MNGLDDLAQIGRGLIVAGWGSGAFHDAVVRASAATGWPVLADAISNVRTGPHAVAHYEALLRAPGWGDAHRPDIVVRVGGPLTSRVAMEWLDASVPQVLIDDAGIWLDPFGTARRRVRGDPARVLDAITAAHRARDDEWSAAWRRADAIAATAIAEVATGEPRTVRAVWDALPAGAHLLAASSMPVRDLEWFATPRRGVTVHANRGVNGIDGLVSTTLGIAIGSGAPTVGLLGDLALLHDVGGLLGARDLDVRCVFVVLDNRGGAIFSFLAQAQICPPDEFELLFATPPGTDPAAVAAAYGVPVEVATSETVAAATTRRLAEGGVHVVVVRSDRAANVEHHRTIWSAVALRV